MFFCPFFLITDFLIPAVITQIFILTAEFVIPTGISRAEARAKFQKQLAKVDAKNNSKFSKLNTSPNFTIFLCFLLFN